MKIIIEIKKKSAERNDVDFFTALIFPTEKERGRAHEQLGLSENRYQDGLKILEIIGKIDKQ